MLFQSVIQWKQMVWQRLKKHILEQQAAVTHDTSLLTHCFSTWTRLVNMESRCYDFALVTCQNVQKTPLALGGLLVHFLVHLKQLFSTFLTPIS